MYVRIEAAFPSLAFLSLSLFSFSCSPVRQQQATDSELRVLGGTDTKDYPAVVPILSVGNCTGTFIAKNALITAAHCIYDVDGTGNVKYEDSRGQVYQSIKAYHHGVFGDPVLEQALKMDQQDVAIILFAEDIAPAVMEMDFPKNAGGAAATIIGYGFQDANMARGTKKSAEVTIAKVVGGQSFLLEGPKSISHGDSGGPLIVGRKIVGTASFSNEMEGAQRKTAFANLSHPENINLLLKAQKGGAKIQSAIPAELGAPSRSPVAGKTYQGNLFCSTASQPVAECTVANSFRADGTLVIKFSNRNTDWQGRYRQVGDVIRAGDASNFDFQNPQTYFEYHLYRDGALLGDDSGHLSSAGSTGQSAGGGSQPSRPEIDRPQPSRPQPGSPQPGNPSAGLDLAGKKFRNASGSQIRFLDQSRVSLTGSDHDDSYVISGNKVTITIRSGGSSFRNELSLRPADGKWTLVSSDPIEGAYTCLNCP